MQVSESTVDGFQSPISTQEHDFSPTRYSNHYSYTHINIKTLWLRIHCRLETEYEVLGHLGKGGFGLVLHVKKKLDNAHYAIKIIKLPNV